MTSALFTAFTMTRDIAPGCPSFDDAKHAEVRRILLRYVVEIVEAYGLCPWATAARTGGGLAIGVVLGTPALADWLAAAERLLANPATQVAMVVAPELACDRATLAATRDAVAARLPAAGVADFHPDAALDLATPARAVPFARRSPDPLLQLVPLALLDDVRRRDLHSPTLAAQTRMLGGHAAPPQPAIAERIAGANHATFARDAAAIDAALAAIAEDRRASYARVHISACR